MSDAWDLIVERNDLSRTTFVDRELAPLEDGEVLLRVDRVGVTANNVTYALVGESMKYWDFFPAAAGKGRVPHWGFVDVEASNVPGVAVGTRVYGYVPPSSHLVVRPERIDAAGFRDASAHRAHLPGAYNIYATTTGDPAYEAHREDLQILYRPLFITSFMLDDLLSDNGYFGAEQVLLSSASSKTAYGTAFCARLHADPPRLIGLTSKGNVAFTESLGCYDEVVAYEDVTTLDADIPTVYADMAGNAALRASIHAHFGDALRYDAVVGATHLDAQLGGGGPRLPGPRPTFFFAPDQIQKRRSDWGPKGVETRFGEAWRAFVPAVEGWVDVTVGKGRDDLRNAWLEVLSGKADPRTGHVVQL
jgi:hypothetical protein